MLDDLNIAISYTDKNKISLAENLAAQLGLPFIEDANSTQYDYLLIYSDDYLGLHKTSEIKNPPFYIDFLSKKLLYRIQKASLRKETLARAIGKNPRENPVIIDATAGLGRDSFILASLGFHLILLEQSPILHALLADALERAKTQEKTASIVERMQLIHANSITWLKDKQADVVYLDPMFPKRQKSAFVKKEMLTLQNLLGKEDKNHELFLQASACASYRIVVKRPRLAENITNKCPPNFSLQGKKSRFDIYLGSCRVL